MPRVSFLRGNGYRNHERVRRPCIREFLLVQEVRQPVRLHEMAGGAPHLCRGFRGPLSLYELDLFQEVLQRVRNRNGSLA
jgi:hypothetical protein